MVEKKVEQETDNETHWEKKRATSKEEEREKYCAEKMEINQAAKTVMDKKAAKDEKDDDCRQEEAEKN